MTPDPAPLHVLVVCTGNLNRSPMAAALLARALTERGVPADVRSAGFVTEDLPSPPNAVTSLAEHGLDLSGHRSRLLTADMVRWADLVIGMERRHVREVAVLDRDAFAKTFTLVELVRRAETVGPHAPDQPLETWLHRVGGGRSPHDLLRDDDADDVPDPHRQNMRAYRRAVATIDELVTELADLLAPGVPGSGLPAGERGAQGKGGSSAP